MGDPRELEWTKKPDALKESWTARIGTHMVHGVSPYTFPSGKCHRNSDICIRFCPSERVENLDRREHF
jgi:hypothetical protein